MAFTTRFDMPLRCCDTLAESGYQQRAPAIGELPVRQVIAMRMGPGGVAVTYPATTRQRVSVD